MSETQNNNDVYDLIAEFARSSNPNISQKEIMDEFVNPFNQHENEVQIESLKNQKIPTSESLHEVHNFEHLKYNELNLKFELLSEQFKDAQKQISKIKQIFSLNEPVTTPPPPPSQEYYHKEFQALSAKLNEVFVTNYKQIETKFEALQAEMTLGRQKGDSLVLDQNKIMNSFKIQFSQIQQLKEKLEGIKEIFIEKTGTSENTITKEDLKTEFANFTNSHIQQFNEHILKNEEAKRNQEIKPISNESKSIRSAFPTWLIWLNVFVLGLMSMYVLNQIFQQNSSDNNSNRNQIETTDTQEANEPNPKTEISSAQEMPKSDSGFIKPIVLQRIDSLNKMEQEKNAVSNSIRKSQTSDNRNNKVQNTKVLSSNQIKEHLSPNNITPSNEEKLNTTKSSQINSNESFQVIENQSNEASKPKDSNKSIEKNKDKEPVTFGVD